MMLFKNDIFTYGGVRYRLLYADPATDSAYVINMDDDKAWPMQASWSELTPLSPLSGATQHRREEETTNVQGPISASLKVTPATRRAQDTAIKILGELPTQVPDIFDPALRGRLVAERVQQGFARSAIYKHLRRFWMGGQTPAALLGNYHRCGPREGEGTAGRGAKPRFGQDTYQLTQTDYGAMRDIIERLYLKDSRIKITHAYQRLLEEHYQGADGNGKLWIRPIGERPSPRQFEYFLRKHYSLEHRLRKREGEKDFERNHRAILDTILSRCQGVGHQYEADATIADVYLVAKDDRRRIVGKPTIYFIIDRKSRLIVGWYIGLENSSWECAMQALLTVSMDKNVICERYGVKYEPSDWPAHQVFPGELISDRELLQHASDQIADELITRIVNLPAQRPDHKPIVETQFKLTRMRLQDGTPGMDPPENAKRRMGRHYEKDACLTLDEFVAIMLLSIIEHNRTPMKGYELSLAELTDEVEPSPIGVWNSNIVTRAGALTRYPEGRVRLALLPRGNATVSEKGIFFKGCYYTCPEAIERGWFVSARNRRFKLIASYDGRLVDSIYVHNTAKQRQRAEVYACVLTPQSQKFAGLSFAEVKVYEHLRAQMKPTIEQRRIQSRADFHSETKPIIDNATKKLKASGPKVSRTARRADIKDDRQAERRIERQATASLPALKKSTEATPSKSATNASISVGTTTPAVFLQTAPNAINTSKPSTMEALSSQEPIATETSEEPSPSRSLAEKARLMREKMRHG